MSPHVSTVLLIQILKSRLAVDQEFMYIGSAQADAQAEGVF